MKKRINILSRLIKHIRNIWNHGIKPVFLVWFHDLRAIRTNLAALFIITGLCLIPSLYAWINIYACWDPYANTGNLPVAIVNKDEGAVMGGKIINVGDSILESMKENKAMNWDFVDEWQGNYGLNEGKYYAMIEIPENFSSRLTSLSTTTPQKPVIVYRVNEKLNAIAAKITNVAKEKLAANIKSNFVKTVNEQVIETYNEETSKNNMDSIKISDLKTTIENAQMDISKLKAHVSKENANSVEFQTYLNSTTALLPKITEQVDSLENVIQASKSFNSKTIQTITTINTDLNTDIAQVKSLNEQNQLLLNEFKNMNANTIDKDLIAVMQQTIEMCTAIHELIILDKQSIGILNENNKYNTLTYLTHSLNYTDQLVLEEKKKLEALIPIMQADTTKASVDLAINDLSKISDELSQRIETLANAYYKNGIPTLTSISNDLNLSLDYSSSVLESTKVIVPQLSALSSFMNVSSRLTVQQREQLDDMLTTLQTDVDTLLEKMDGISSEKVENLIEIIKNNPTGVTDFLASPLEVKEQDVYEGGTFGVGLTPFYTVLAIWVGSLLLCAMLSVECEAYVFGIKLNIIQKHYGKMILFLSLSLIQALIITVGDVYIVGVKPENFMLMIQFSLLASVTFTVMIFTLVSIFGNVGKAIAVVIMVFQIAGSGGIYPIQTNPEIFGKMLALWPFTYAMNGIREAIAGPVWSSVAYNAMALVCFIVTFLLLAILKKPFHRMNMFFEHKFKEADL